MALVKCRECAGNVSADAVTCPHCGASQPGLSNDSRVAVAKQFKFARGRAIGGWLFFAGILWLGVAATAGADAFAAAFGGAKWLIGLGAVVYLFAEIDRNLTERKVK